MSERTFVQFRVGSTAYGLPVTQVVEIIRVVGLSPVPNPAPDLLGMVNLRGRIIPVFDLHRTLELGERPLSLRMYIVIADVEDEAVGIVVDDVLDVVAVPAEHFKVSRALAGNESYTNGVARVGAELMTVLSLAPLLDRAPSAQSASEP